MEAVLRDRYFDGMLRRLCPAFPQLPQQAVEDALFDAAEKCARRRTPPDNVRAWLFTAAKHGLIDVTRKRRVDVLHEEDPDHESGWRRSAEDEAFPEDTYETVVRHVNKWPASKMRATVLIVLEAAHLGEPLPNAELAAQVSAALGEEMSGDATAQTKSRGLRRLRDEYPLIFPER